MPEPDTTITIAAGPAVPRAPLGEPPAAGAAGVQEVSKRRPKRVQKVSGRGQQVEAKRD